MKLGIRNIGEYLKGDLYPNRNIRDTIFRPMKETRTRVYIRMSKERSRTITKKNEQ